VDFLPVTANNEHYFDEGTRLCDKSTDVLDTVNSETSQDLMNATEELSRHCEELQELQLGLRSSLKILKIDELFRSRECRVFLAEKPCMFTLPLAIPQLNK
jgi:hypothetical protein